MQIMLTNDDGVYAYGILALAKALQAQGGHQIHIVAPDREQSGTAHSFTFLTPLHAEPVRLEGLENGDAFGVSGTPTDCVKVGVSNLLADKPDCIISGINHGQNLGIDTTYSGTVSAALEGALLGIPSMAVSLVGSMRKLGDKKQAYFDAAANIAAALLPRFCKAAVCYGMSIFRPCPRSRSAECALRPWLGRFTTAHMWSGRTPGIEGIFGRRSASTIPMIPKRIAISAGYRKAILPLRPWCRI